MLRSRIDDIENSFSRKYDNSTVESFLHYWLDVYCVPRLAPNTVRGYRVNIDNHIIPHIGNIPLNRLKPTDIQGLYSILLDKGLSGTTVRYVHHNLHKALAFACKEEIIPRNPADKVEPPSLGNFESNVLTVEQVKSLLVVSKESEIYLPILLAVTLGLRRGEVLALQWSDISFEYHTLTIYHSAYFDKSGFHFSSTKSKNSMRTLKLTDFVYNEIISEFKNQSKYRKILGSKYNPFNLVCCRSDGSFITPNILQHQFRDILSTNGLPNIRFHDLRHTNATLMLRGSVPAKIVSSMLGHSSIGITLDTYSHVITEMQDPAISYMDSILDNLY